MKEMKRKSIQQRVLGVLLSLLLVLTTVLTIGNTPVKVKAKETPKSGSTVYCYTEEEYYFYVMDSLEDVPNVKERTIIFVGNPNNKFKNVVNAANTAASRSVEANRLFTEKVMTYNGLTWFLGNVATMEPLWIQSTKKNGEVVGKDYIDDVTKWYTPEGEKEYAKARKVLLDGLRGLNLGACNNDIEIITKVSDWICSKLTYDSNSDYEENRDYFSIVTGKGVCEEYSDITALALQELGYECVKLGGYGWQTDGSSGTHTWNAVKMSDGKWYEIDNTWRDSVGGYMLMNMRSDHELFPTGSGYANDEVKYAIDNLATGNYTNTSTKRLLNAFLINIVDKNQEFNVGDEYTLPKDQLVKVVSDNPSVVSVENGKLICKKSGRANITRNDGTYQSGFAVLVKTDTTPMLSVKSTASVKVGKTVNLEVKASNNWFKEGMNVDRIQKASYTSSNKKIVTVNSSGTIKGIKKGTATITIKCGSVEKKVKVTVK